MTQTAQEKTLYYFNHHTTQSYQPEELEGREKSPIFVFGNDFCQPHK